MKNEVKQTAHSSYRCEYHIVFAPKYRRKVIYKQIRKDIGEILRKLCHEMKVEIITLFACSIFQTAAPGNAPFISHCERSHFRQVIRPRAHNPCRRYAEVKFPTKRKQPHQSATVFLGCGRRTRTYDLRVMRSI